MVGITLVAVVLALIVIVLWVLLPFLVMGTNKRLDALTREMRALNAKIGERPVQKL